jgi:L-seryl-tRNA(Ser) seleniumtransferase
VDAVLKALGPVALPRSAVVATIRRELADLRESGEIPALERIVRRVGEALDRLGRSRLQPVINGTGVVVHTNLGRAPMGAAVARRLGEIATQYSNLEISLDSGERGARAAYLEHNLALLCGAEGVTVTNNCAAALVLVLRHLTRGERREVVISRGELIQIGGGFRIPEILEASGAILREVGTTNRTTVDDYSRAIRRETALILKVHPSNFHMSGFVESAPTEAISRLARSRRLPLIEDLGSGAMVDTATLAGIEHEPTPSEVLRRGVDLVCFSGDKLMGGPQAGILAGKARLISRLKKESFYRALRCDKLVLAALETTVDHYLRGELDDIPVLRLLRTSNRELQERAERIVSALAGLPLEATMGTGNSCVGGGSLPRTEVASTIVRLRPLEMRLEELAERLRRATPPVIGQRSSGRLHLDLRTVFPGQDDALISVIRSVYQRSAL